MKKHLKSEVLKIFEDFFEDDNPDENNLEVGYNFLFLKCKENRRKSINILNSFRAIQRRLTFDLFSIFECEIPKDLDEKSLQKVSITIE